MNENKQQSINLNIIIKIIYRNIFLIGLTTIVIAGMAGFYAFRSKAFKSEIILYGNDRVLNEIGLKLKIFPKNMLTLLQDIWLQRKMHF